MVIIFKTDSLNSIHICMYVCVYNSVLLTIVAMLCIESPRICLLVGSLCPLTWHLSIFPTPQPLITTILLSVRISAVLDCVSENIQCLSCSVRFLPLGVLPLRASSVVTEARASSSLWLDYCPALRVRNPQFIRSVMDTDCFPLLTLVSNAAVNTEVQVSL